MPSPSTFIAPALNHLTLGYEQLLGPRMSLAVKLGYIGIGHYTENYNTIHTAGALGKVGIRFILPVSRRRIPSSREGHPLAGWYLKPELIISAWSSEQQYYYHNNYPYSSSTNDFVSTALNMTVGRQVLLGERFTSTRSAASDMAFSGRTATKFWFMEIITTSARNIRIRTRSSEVGAPSR